MSVLQALQEVPRWHVGDTITIRGHCVVKVAAISPTSAEKVPFLTEDSAAFYYITQVNGAPHTVTLSKMGKSTSIQLYNSKDDFDSALWVGGRRSRISAEIFNESDEDAEIRVRRSSADGSAPPGIGPDENE